MMRIKQFNNQSASWLLTLGALGVVFGDIGTSPLYALAVLFGGSGAHHLATTSSNIYGVISLIIWSVVIIVCAKYIGFMMKADNRGEGGILALVAMLRASALKHRLRWTFMLLGIVGLALFYGDGAITPAISVLSAVEGLKIVTPSLASWVVPVTVVIICLLFWLQRKGTETIGKLFGPVMLLWFVVIGIFGLLSIVQHPDGLQALNPWCAISFFAGHPFRGFIAMTAVVLAITGAEALYADMGHFGRRAIAKAWYLVVLPGICLCYLGQGAQLVHAAGASGSPFYHIFPSVLAIPAIVLATAATLIASQSVISGTFSLTRQAIHLGLLPKMSVRHTSDIETGQVYVPLVNSLLFVAVVLLVVGFGSSSGLAGAYGVAISGALLIDTILLMVVVVTIRRLPRWSLLPAIFLFLPLELLFVSSNSTKIVSGGWFPIGVALAVIITVLTWLRGQSIISRERKRRAGTLDELVQDIRAKSSHLTRVPGQAVYIAHHPGFAPLALKQTIDLLRELPEELVIVGVKVVNAAHVPPEERVRFDPLTYKNDRISYVELTFGYHDSPNVPRALESVKSHPGEADFDVSSAEYFVSLTKIIPGKTRKMPGWQRALYMFMQRNQRSSSDHLHLPTGRTIDVETLLEL